MINDCWLLIVFTRKIRRMRRSAGGLWSGTQIIREVKKNIYIHRWHRWTLMEVRRRTMWVNANYRELNVNWRKNNSWKFTAYSWQFTFKNYQCCFVGERELSGIKRELKKKLFMEINGIFMAIHVQKLSMLFWGWTRIIGNRPWIGGNRSASGRETSFD